MNPLVSLTPDELSDLSPQQTALIRDRAEFDARIRALIGRCQSLTQEIQALEADVDQRDGVRVEELKKERLQLVAEVTKLLN